MQDQPAGSTPWRPPLTDDQLIAILAELAKLVAEGELADFSAAVGAYHDRELHAGRAGLSAEEARYLGRVVRSSLPQAARAPGLWQEDALFVNDSLARALLGTPASADARCRLLAERLGAAVDFVNEGGHRTDGLRSAQELEDLAVPSRSVAASAAPTDAPAGEGR